MKIRNGFVSNSSSTSFTCDVCGYECGGWDYSLDDANMYECENGHTFCRDEVINKDDPEWEQLNDLEVIPAKFCPVCNMHAVTNLMKMDYVAFKYNFKWSDITAEIKSKFKTYDEMITYISDSYVTGDNV
jgi:hypothetical protein